ncbi:hypothetical protein K1719_040803 [Acacia pycnantha]|nr:hypothetical protein K1719_040803 [Acacia pycnantha]
MRYRFLTYVNIVSVALLRNSEARPWKYLSLLRDYGFREEVSVVIENKRKLIEGADLDVVFQEPLKKTMEMMEEEIAKLIQEKEERDKLVAKSLNPEFIVGIEEEPLLRLKMEVLKDGASTLELMGLPRSGKVTLVGKFGSDDHY